MDLKNIDLKNINIEDIKKQILQFTDKKTLIKIGISAGAIIVFLIIYYSILNPLVNKKKLQLDEMNKKKEETKKFIKDIKSTKNYKSNTSTLFPIPEASTKKLSFITIKSTKYANTYNNKFISINSLCKWPN